MPTYIVGMQKEQWIAYDAENAKEAMELAALDYPYWTVVGANDG